MKKKLKLKKNVKILLFAIVVLLFLFIYFYNNYQTKQYEETYEFKFLELGYTLDEIKVLENNFNDDKLDEFLKNEKDEIIFELLDTKYFVKSSFDEYYLYINENDHLSPEKVVQTINTNIDEYFYEDLYEANTTNINEILVNKYYYLEESYNPDDLVTISTKYSWGNYGSQKMLQVTYDAFLNMWNAASDEGHYLMISSSYRSYSDQEIVYNNYKDTLGIRKADEIAARPGHSEHQTGLALDILSLEETSLTEFVNSSSYTWLIDNAHKYGFILRYPEDKTEITGYAFESWHYRFVGENIATYIYENDITFDEYYAYYLK